MNKQPYSNLFHNIFKVKSLHQAEKVKFLGVLFSGDSRIKQCMNRQN